MLVSVDGDLIRLPIGEVLYFTADEKYVFAATPTRTYRFETSLSQIEKEFPDQFWRVHRKYLVKGSLIRGLVKIDGTLFADIAGAKDPIPVSRREITRIKALFRAGDA